MDKLFVGIDVGSRDNAVYIMKPDGSGQFDRKLHVLNPKQVKKFKDAYPDLPKNDPVDAYIIADNRSQHQSGTFEAQHTRLIKSGNRFLKYYLCEAANALVRCDTEYRRYYDLKHKEVKQVPAQTRNRFNCQKIGQVGLSTAQGQPPVYPDGIAAVDLLAPFLKMSEPELRWDVSFCAFFMCLPAFLCFLDFYIDILPPNFLILQA